MELWEMNETELQAVKDAWGMGSWSDQEFFSVYYDEHDDLDYLEQAAHNGLDINSLTDEEKAFLRLLQGKM